MWPFIFLHCRCELPITYEGKIGGKSLSKILNTIPSGVKTKTQNLVFTVLLLHVQVLKGLWENKQASLLVVPLGKARDYPIFVW